VTSLTDGMGSSAATTSYSYADACDTGQCTALGAPQTTTVTYPGEVPCPSCAAVLPIETDVYSGGLETMTTLGSTVTNPDETETWSYSWSLGGGTANTTEQITYPDKINVANNANFIPPTATIVMDPSGNIVSTTNALGDVATSAYNDVGGNNLPELLWSYPGPSSNPPATPPSGASIYTYNSFGQVTSATDPTGATDITGAQGTSITDYGYYPTDSLACYVAPPSVSINLSTPPPNCTGTSDAGATGAPTGSTTFSYDPQGDIVGTTVDANDTGSLSDTQTTTSNFDVMGNEIWTIPPEGQSGLQSPSNLYATTTSYSSSNLPLVVTAPDGMTTTNTYDADFNLTATATPAATTTNFYDNDNRLCYTFGASPAVPATSCGAPSEPGSTTTSFVPGSLAVSSSTDASGNATSYYYDDLAYPTSPTEVVDPLGTQISYSAYDDFGNACVTGSIVTTLGTNQCATISGDVTFVYNALGSATKVTDQNGNVTQNTYTDSAYPTSLTSTENMSLGATTLYTYDTDGRLLTTTNPDGTTGVTTDYNSNGEVCNREPTLLTYPCGEGPSVAGATTYGYNDAQERVLMSDNFGNPATPYQWSQNTSYTYSTGQLTNVTDSNSKSVSYLYNYAGQIMCVAYPVSPTTNCGTVTSPATGSTSNTIVTRSYDSSGRLTSFTDWLGNTTTYTYGQAYIPNSPTKITYPASTGLTANYGYDNNGNVNSLTSGSAITDAWTYNSDQQVATTTINGATSGTVAYNKNHQITAATNLNSSTSNDNYTIAGNGEITADQPPTGSTTIFTYNGDEELCNSATTSVACGTNPSTGTAFQYTANGQRSKATPYTSGTAGSPTYYAWNAFGELCNTGGSSVACGSTPTSGTSYGYNGDGLRMNATTASATTASTWDLLSAGSIPLNINDAATTAGVTTNNSYIYGDLLFGGTAPTEQINGTNVSFLVANQNGVQGVFSSTGSTQELAVYSLYGVQAISSGSRVTPFGFQGSYTDPTGLIYLINRYFDPTTDQFLSIDPNINSTGQAYVFENDNPANGTDPLGEKFSPAGCVVRIDTPHISSYYLNVDNSKRVKVNATLKCNSQVVNLKLSVTIVKVGFAWNYTIATNPAAKLLGSGVDNRGTSRACTSDAVSAYFGEATASVYDDGEVYTATVYSKVKKLPCGTPSS